MVTNQYSKRELDTKIHTFMKKKMHQFPELQEEPYLSEKQHDRSKKGFTPGRRTLSQSFPFIRLSSQY